MFDGYPYKLRDPETGIIHGSFNNVITRGIEPIELDLDKGLFDTHYLIKYIKPKSPDDLYSKNIDIEMPLMELLTDNEISDVYTPSPSRYLRLTNCKIKSLLYDRPEGLVSILTQMKIEVKGEIKIEKGVITRDF